MLCSYASGALADQGVVVVSKDGTTMSLTLPEVKRIDIGAEGIVLHSADASTPIAHADLDHIKIGTDVTGVKELLKPGDIAVWPTAVSDFVNITGLDIDAPVSVYSLRSTRRISHRLRWLCPNRPPRCSPGMYIVKAADTSVKIIKN